MTKTRNVYDDNFKLKVALEAICNKESINELCNKFNVASGQIYEWKKHLENHGHEIFIDKRTTKKTHNDDDDKKLLIQLEKITAERDFLVRVLNQ